MASDDDEQWNQCDPREDVKLEVWKREDQKECGNTGRAPLGSRSYLPHREESKNFFLRQQIQSDCEWSISWFLTQKDRFRHRGTDKLRHGHKKAPEAHKQTAKLFMCLLCLFVAKFKSGRTQSLLTGSTYRGEALKERSEGCWRSGRRRSGDVGGGGTVTVCHFRVVPVIS